MATHTPYQRILLIVSDLHVANGDTLLDGFGQRQQAALEGLLAAAGKPPIHRGAGSPLSEANDVELILNGDCFDFLFVAPHDIGGVMHADLAVEKLRKITAAHGPFFETLHRFVSQPGRRITIMMGNHDMELCFAEVRAGIMEAMGMQQDDRRIYFCPTPSYRPLPDVYIEHGHAYHFWCCDRSGFWDAPGHVWTANPRVMTLPLEARYMQHVAHPILARYPYLGRFEPSLSIVRQTALLCLLDPPVIVEAVQHIIDLLDTSAPGQPHKGLPHLLPGEECHPITLFDQATKALMAFQWDAVARSPQWKEPLGKRAAFQARVRALMEVAMLRKALSKVSNNKDLTKAIATICTPPKAPTRDSVAAGIHPVLNSDLSLRYAFAGHTHTALIDPIKDGRAKQQVYLNTGSWLSPLALPTPGEVTPELVAWLREPYRAHIPLREVPPQPVFALIDASERPSSANLCVWEGDSNGHYRVLAY